MTGRRYEVLLTAGAEQDLEAIYSFPIPRSASLSEMTIWAGEKELNGEVLPSRFVAQPLVRRLIKLSR